MYVINMSTTAHSPRPIPTLLACVVGALLGLGLSSATDGLTTVPAPKHAHAVASSPSAEQPVVLSLVDQSADR